MLENIYGNIKTRERLSNALANRTLSHAYILRGVQGSGKHTLALSVSAALNCDGGTTGAVPCMRCMNCKRIFNGQFTDLKVLSLQSGKASIGVDEVRLIREDMFLSASESNYKVYIFEDADKLTTQAQNALLKVLEEPISGVVIFLFCESADRLLTTIRSRAPMITMEYFSPEEIDAYLTRNYEIARVAKMQNPVGYERALYRADGAIGRALSLLDEEKMREMESDYEDVRSLVLSFSARTPYAKMLEEISSVPTRRAEFMLLMEDVLCALSDLIALKKCENVPPRFFPDKEACETVADEFTVARLFYIYDLILESIEKANQNANMTALTALLIAKLKHNS